MKNLYSIFLCFLMLVLSACGDSSLKEKEQPLSLAAPEIDRQSYLKQSAIDFLGDHRSFKTPFNAGSKRVMIYILAEDLSSLDIYVVSGSILEGSINTFSHLNSLPLQIDQIVENNKITYLFETPLLEMPGGGFGMDLSALSIQQLSGASGVSTDQAPTHLHYPIWSLAKNGPEASVTFKIHSGDMTYYNNISLDGSEVVLAADSANAQDVFGNTVKSIHNNQGYGATPIIGEELEVLKSKISEKGFAMP